MVIISNLQIADRGPSIKYSNLINQKIQTTNIKQQTCWPLAGKFQYPKFQYFVVFTPFWY